MSAKMVIDKPKHKSIFYLDKLLGDYYKFQNNNSYYELNENETLYWDEEKQKPKGKFAIFCENNEIEDSDLEGELNETFDACILSKFDEYFPIKNNVSVEQEAYDVMIYCWTIGKAPGFYLDLLDVNEQDLNETEKIYSTQCPQIYPQKNSILSTVYAIGVKS